MVSGGPQLGADSLPKKLIFKSNTAAFEYACKFNDNSISQSHAIVSLLADPPAVQVHGFSSSVYSMYLNWRREDDQNLFTTHMVRVATERGGFDALGVCYEKQAVFKFGDLIAWYAFEQILPAIEGITPPEGVWLGVIVARLTPEFSTSDGSFIASQLFTAPPPSKGPNEQGKLKPNQPPSDSLAQTRKIANDPHKVRDYVFGLAGFVIGAGTSFAFEILVLYGIESLWGEHLRPLGPGWLLVPIGAGIAGWRGCMELGFDSAIR